MAFSETWLSPNIRDSEVYIPGYHFSRADRHGVRSGGGVILYWRTNLKAHLLDATCAIDGGFEALWCRIHDGCRSLLVCVAYRSPLGSGALLLDSIKSHAKGKDCLIVGDFNAPGIDWDLLYCGLPSDSFDALLLQTVLDCNLSQHVFSPTRLFSGQTPHILDLVLSPMPSDVTDLVIMQPIGKSDHCAISFQWARRFSVHDQGDFRRNFWRADPQRLQEAASNMDWTIPHFLCVDDAWTHFYSNMMSLINQVVPISKSRGLTRGPPWIDKQLRSLMNKRRKLWDRFKCTQSTADYLQYKTLRNLCILKKRENRQNYEFQLAVQSRCSPKMFFSYLKRGTKGGNGIPSLYSSKHAALLQEDAAKADLLAQQYSSVFTNETPFSDVVLPCSSLLDHLEISTETVTQFLLQLDPNTSPGPDGLHPLFLKTVAKYIAAPACHVFRCSIESGRLPSAWKLGIVKPIFKGGNRQDPANYRPVCLTSVMCKIMERILKGALSLYFDDRNVISTAQHGFRKSRSCTTNLLVSREKWANSLDAGKRMDVIYVDFSKAFDKVPHERLLFKLQAIGVSGRVLSWISDFLSDRIMRVKVNDTYSPSVLMSSGVPQGSVLGPELFKFFINDLPSTLRTECLIYADDLKLWMEVTSAEDADRLQNTLDRLHDWSLKWQLPINRDKCSVLPIGATEPFGVYHLGGYLLNNVKQERDLGVIVCCDLKTTQDTLKKVAAANRLLCSIRRAFSRLTPEIFRLIFSSHVRPILEYGLPAVHPLTKLEHGLIEKVQRRGSKYIFEFRHLPYHIRLQHLNMFSLEYRRRRGDLIYARRILRGEMGNELQGFFQVNTECSTRGHCWKLFKPRRLRLRSDFTLSTRVVNDWNCLPNSVVNVHTEECFKRLLDLYFLNLQGSCCFLCNCDNLTC
ncbi:unnamed protein product [Dicrocoelium dendriticum]|nr:unnamed protein product [Dicrocoelium dendriticum]